ncbi:MAG: hypothetical protein RLZZ524_1784 [Pseudomonadota bacterium]
MKSTTRSGARAAVAALMALAIGSLTFFGAPAAHAWGQTGHELIADLAQSRLSPAADAEVRRLLARVQAGRLAEVASWADEHRTAMTASWHYVNLPPETCEYQPAAHCLHGRCAVEATNRQLAVLALDADDDERLQALRYVVHLVADLHQPLHAGQAADRGGNTYQIRWERQGSNLHALWDSGLIDARPGGTPALRRDVMAGRGRPAPGSSPADWAEASCRIARTEGFYPAAHKVNARYAQRWDAVLVGQIDAAAWRLAEVLEDVLGQPERRAAPARP